MYGSTLSDHLYAPSLLKTCQSNQMDNLVTCRGVRGSVCALLGNKVVSQQDYKDLCNIVPEGQRVLNECMCVMR